jgi:hypothetical protein
LQVFINMDGFGPEYYRDQLREYLRRHARQMQLEPALDVAQIEAEKKAEKQRAHQMATQEELRMRRVLDLTFEQLLEEEFTPLERFSDEFLRLAEFALFSREIRLLRIDQLRHQRAVLLEDAARQAQGRRETQEAERIRVEQQQAAAGKRVARLEAALATERTKTTNLERRVGELRGNTDVLRRTARRAPKQGVKSYVSTGQPLPLAEKELVLSKQRAADLERQLVEERRLAAGDPRTAEDASDGEKAHDEEGTREDQTVEDSGEDEEEPETEDSDTDNEDTQDAEEAQSENSQGEEDESDDDDEAGTLPRFKAASFTLEDTEPLLLAFMRELLAGMLRRFRRDKSLFEACLLLDPSADAMKKNFSQRQAYMGVLLEFFDGLPLDNNAATSARDVAAMGVAVDTFYRRASPHPPATTAIPDWDGNHDTITEYFGSLLEKSFDNPENVELRKIRPFCKLALAVLVILPTSVICEQMFSKYNGTKTKGRHSMLTEIVKSFLTLSRTDAYGKR